MAKQKLVVIVGPTASGKTALAIEAAKKIDAEIICADSRTVYKDMDIGTAKPTAAEMNMVPHWGLDLVNPDEHFQAFDFQQYARRKIKEIAARGKKIIIAGGAGLYIAGLIDNFDFEGGKRGESNYDVLQIGLNVPREQLYNRINQRVDEMMESGLLDEVRKIRRQYGCDIKAMTGIGYRQLCQFLNGEIDLEEAVRLIKRDSRHYAKRQMTWFKADDRIKWVNGKQQALKLIINFYGD
ncbi:tRNA dimethylallyltransferase [Candidatus Parcubacteria bacterium]|nr:MAG: tRNA dimethylallyltransferase [Candidatus Parcubacteria bacterium]